MFIPSPTPGLGYGGADYGYSPYGHGYFPAPPVAPTGGYGGATYGLSSYGSLDVDPPRVTGAASIDGYTVEVFFSEPMLADAALLDPASYTFTPTTGATSTTVAVTLGTASGGGYTSVILTHTGTTLGGSYALTVAATVKDFIGNYILPTARTAYFLALGATPTFTVTPTAGDVLEVAFSENMLPESGFSPGIGDLPAYSFATTYPVPLVLDTITHPVGSDYSKVDLGVTGMTSAQYTLTISPAESIGYDGTILPSASTSFTGVSVGTGSSAVGVGGLQMTKAAGATYGWAFEDTSGRVLPSSSYRVDVDLNPAAAVYTPALYDATVGTLLISDGAVQVSISLSRVAGVDVIDVVSGGYTAQVPASWSTGATTITLVRNQKADIYAVMINEVVLASAATGLFTGVPSISPGAQFTLGPAYAVTAFPLQSVSFTATQTVFSASWNFLHGVVYTFTGSSALTRPTLLTRRGPLVKDWGDPTPATKNDVEVRVNGVAVGIDVVNPYLGAITPTIPIPLTPVGTTTVDVDYTWFPAPVMEVVGLNTLGLALNKWDIPRGNPSDTITPSGGLGVADTQRFPMGLVLAPYDRVRPVLIGHRYIGFEQAYTAALNSPTTLLLNQNPHAISRGDLQESPGDVAVSYDGDNSPLTSSPPWYLTGTDSGHVGTGVDRGYYVVVDGSSGTYPTGQAAFYSREEDFSFPSTGTVAVRLDVPEYTLDGVFSGVAFGLHDNRHLYFVGLLEVNGVHHVGLLLDPLRPYAVESWQIGPGFDLAINSSDSFTTTSQAFLDLIARGGGSGLVFQILDGPQVGIYTLSTCGLTVNASGTVATGVITGTFPADPSLEGNRDATGYVETNWDTDVLTYRLVADVPDADVEVYIGGTLSGLALSNANAPAYPAETTLILPTAKKGSVFWGSLSRAATSTSRWALVRYGITYDQATFHFNGIVVAAEMSTTPDEDNNHQWFVSEDFGIGEIDSSGNTLLLTSDTSSTSIDTTFGYARVEPFLSDQVLIDLDATFRVDTGVLGAGDAAIQIRNGSRQVDFRTILYADGGSPYRRLVDLPAPVCITALQDPTEEGWTNTGSTLAESILENRLVLTQTVGTGGLYTSAIVPTADVTGGRVFEARFAVVSSTGLSATSGPRFGGRFDAAGRDIQIALTDSPRRVRVLSGGATVVAYAFDWGDGAYHDYRVVCDQVSAMVSVLIDDTVAGTIPFASFSALGSPYQVSFGADGPTATSVTHWASYAATVLPAATVHRTLGVLQGLDPSDIDSWVIPRTDSSPEPNSSSSAIVEEMDWRSNIDVRVRIDPGWGVTVFRPDLPPPPYYTGDFITEYTEPSAGWINIEYENIPRVSDVGLRFGRVAFGALDPMAVTQQRWRAVRYRIYTQGSENFIAPEHMVLNWANVINSGELNLDTTMEVVAIEAIDAYHVYIPASNIYADRVYSVVVGSTVLASTGWTFDAITQIITFTNPLPSAHEPVTVSFVAGRPVTNTYLCSQPLMQSVTLLNEGTPIVPLSQVGSAIREEVFGSQINDPTDTVSPGDADFITNDHFRYVTFIDDPNVLYEALETCSVDDGGASNVLSIACDGPSPENGWIGIELSGTAYSDGFSQVGGPARGWGSPVLRDNLLNFNQSSMILAAGGVIGATTAGVLNASITYPSYPSIAWNQGAINRSFTVRMRMTSVLIDASDPNNPIEIDLIEDWDVSNTWLDTPATATMVDAASTTYSRLGPWGGETALATRSQLCGNGYPPSGMGLVLQGGASLGPGPTTTVTVL